ncbi:hypothetical protein C8R41DRAFT_870367 [Lentinula lateritia]|uniref:Uncharacterized protein n=1 Tax=Lentinula lateritia TaxID=40482 RepID=A0ABQ8V4M5_9AGAR|nr:hypothetical protein C8R41DRAFT_870367 [Lentinula lateritia]
MLGLSEREQRRQRVARASRVTNCDLDDGERDSNDIGIAVTPKVHETIVIDLSSESEDEELQDNYNPHQELEGHNVQVKELETESIRAKEKASRKLPSLTEQLNYADSRLESFMQHGHRVDRTNDTHSQLVEFEEKKQLEQENERLHKENTELKCQLNNIIQHDLAEHTHLNILNRLLLQTKHDFLHENMSPPVVIETFDNLSSQLRELADRRLENIPVGFGSIMGVISHQNGRANIKESNEGYTSRKQHVFVYITRTEPKDPGVRSSGISQNPSSSSDVILVLGS